MRSCVLRWGAHGLAALALLACGRVGRPDDAAPRDAPPGVPGGPELLYNLGTLRPRAIHYADGQLYFGAWPPYPRPGYEFYQAPADGSSAPQLLGMIDTPDAGISGQVLATTDDFVFWAEGSSLVRYQRASGVIDSFDGNFALRLPDARVLLVDGERVVIAQGDCSTISVFALPEMERTTFNVDPLPSDALGQTRLFMFQGSFYCTSQKRVLALNLDTGQAKDAYINSSWFMTEVLGYGNELYLLLSRPNDRANLNRINAAGQAEVVATFEGEHYMTMVTDEARGVFFAVPATANEANLYKVEVGSWAVSQFAGQAKLRSSIVQDDNYLYWSTDNLLDAQPEYRTGIYRQLKDAPTQ